MREEMIQILNVTKDELIQIVKEGVKLELNRQKAIGQTTFNNSDEKYLSSHGRPTASEPCTLPPTTKTFTKSARPRCSSRTSKTLRCGGSTR